MSSLLALADPNADTFDVLMLVAMIIFAVAAVVSFMRNALVEGLVAAGLGVMSLGFLFLT